MNLISTRSKLNEQYPMRAYVLEYSLHPLWSQLSHLLMMGVAPDNVFGLRFHISTFLDNFLYSSVNIPSWLWNLTQSFQRLKLGGKKASSNKIIKMPIRNRFPNWVHYLYMLQKWWKKILNPTLGPYIWFSVNNR